MQIISASIDLNKIDKSRIVTIDKNGNPFKNGAKYLPVTIIVNNSPDEYGYDIQVTMGQTKEERDAKVKRTFIGNGKTVWREKPKQDTSKSDFMSENDLQL